MPRVKIDTPGVTVEVDANEASAKELADLALQLFKDAGGWPQTEPRGIGFGASTERRWTPTHRDIKSRGDFEPVHAEGTGS